MGEYIERIIAETSGRPSGLSLIGQTAPDSPDWMFAILIIKWFCIFKNVCKSAVALYLLVVGELDYFP